MPGPCSIEMRTQLRNYITRPASRLAPSKAIQPSMSSNAVPGPSDIILEDTDPRVVYDAFATWTTSTDGSLSDLGSTYHYTDTRGAWVSCSFVGTHIWYIANTKYNYGNNSITVRCCTGCVLVVQPRTQQGTGPIPR